MVVECEVGIVENRLNNELESLEFLLRLLANVFKGKRKRTSSELGIGDLTLAIFNMEDEVGLGWGWQHGA